MIDRIKIGDFLRKLRNEKSMTQEELAEKFGVSSRSVSRWENGNTMPELGLLVELAVFYGVDINEIIDGERKSENMEQEVVETLAKAADYAKEEKKLAVESVKQKSHWTIISIVLYFIPIILALAVYATLEVVARIGPINIWVGLVFAILLVSAVLMAKNKWWGSFLGIAIGAFLIGMSTQYTGQVIDIERPLGIILCLYYAFCGFMSFKYNQNRKAKLSDGQ